MGLCVGYVLAIGVASARLSSIVAWQKAGALYVFVFRGIPRSTDDGTPVRHQPDISTDQKRNRQLAKAARFQCAGEDHPPCKLGGLANETKSRIWQRRKTPAASKCAVGHRVMSFRWQQ